MPVRHSLYWSGVRVHEVRALDRWLAPVRGRQPTDIPDYEEALVEGLRTLVRPGDRVVVVGGGFGVTSVVAAQRTGPKGLVVCYEASVDQLGWIRSTLALNRNRRLMAPVRVVHAWVGARPPAEPTVVGAPAIAPDELPSCDVLELDCEGAELDILERMTIQPRALVVEAHGVFGAPTETVRRVIESRGYQVLWVRLAEERLHDLHEAQDVRVLVALR